MRYRKSEEFKDSGVDFIDKVPRDWDVAKTKFLLRVTDGTHDTPEYVEKNDESYPLVTTKDLVSGTIDFSDTKYISKEDYLNINKRSNVEVGDVIMPMIGTIGNPVLVETERKFSIKNVALFKTSNSSINKRFFYYYLRSMPFYDQLDLLTRGGVQSFVSLGVLQNIYLTKPTSKDQCRVATFLDRKTEAIDQLIRKKEQLIERLKEKRQALITEAVTKGLDPDVPMKDSGIEWLGEIPELWDVFKIKFTSYLKARVGWHGLTTNEYQNTGPYLVTGTDFQDGKVVWENCHHVSLKRYEEDPYIQLEEGDILITKDGTIGKTAIIKDLPDKATLNTGVFVLRPLDGKYTKKFMYWLLNSSVFNEYIEYSKTGSTVAHLYQETFSNWKFPAPPLHEQLKIVERIDELNTKIQSLIKMHTEQIEKFREYRQSLISAAVTGKIDIQDEVEVESKGVMV